MGSCGLPIESYKLANIKQVSQSCRGRDSKALTSGYTFKGSGQYAPNKENADTGLHVRLAMRTLKGRGNLA